MPEVADPLDPVTFVDKIKVPVFMACQWQDEQTGGHCPTLVRHFTGTDKKWFTFTNGAHIDSLDPETFNRWYDFLQLYVAKQAPAVNQAVIRAAAPVIYQPAMGLPQSDPITLPPDPIQPHADLRPGARGVREGTAGAGAVRQRRGRLARPAPAPRATPTRRSSSRSPPCPCRARRPEPGTSARGAPWPDSAPSKQHVDWYTSDANALPLTDYAATPATGGLWGNASQWELELAAEPGRAPRSPTSPPR